MTKEEFLDKLATHKGEFTVYESSMGHRRLRTTREYQTTDDYKRCLCPIELILGFPVGATKAYLPWNYAMHMEELNMDFIDSVLGASDGRKGQKYEEIRKLLYDAVGVND